MGKNWSILITSILSLEKRHEERLSVDVNRPSKEYQEVVNVYFAPDAYTELQEDAGQIPEWPRSQEYISKFIALLKLLSTMTCLQVSRNRLPNFSLIRIKNFPIFQSCFYVYSFLVLVVHYFIFYFHHGRRECHSFLYLLSHHI